MSNKKAAPKPEDEECIECGHERFYHSDEGYAPKCTFGCHGYTCDCAAFREDDWATKAVIEAGR